ncbi:MAG: hypothetical protein SFW36_02010 [Leptolyngbyaceae cyanobacterium bins.59]|nr:hypothetical protein [Leptolyngbyaceae cyanobacterium bins.59]
MTKPDFRNMNRQELRKYVLLNRQDDDAIEALIRCGNPNGPRYPFPKTEEDVKQMEEILKRKLNGNQS